MIEAAIDQYYVQQDENGMLLFMEAMSGHIRFCRVNRLTDRLGDINKVIENKLEVI